MSTDEPRTLPSPESLLRQHGLKPKKAWGQNFLRDPSVLDRIAAVLEASEEDLVVELGAGLGHLTASLAATGARIVAIERDRELVPVLEKIFASEERVRVVAADAKTVEFRPLRENDRRLLVAGNLPYHLTTPILFNLLDQREHLARAVLMVQREVADRLAATPGCKDYGILSVQTQMWATVERRFDVAPGSFLPPPGVISSVVRFGFREEPVADPGDPEVFRKTVRAAFSKRRKTLRNTLKTSGLLPGEKVDEVLEEAGLDPMARAETIPLEGFAALSRVIARLQ